MSFYELTIPSTFNFDQDLVISAVASEDKPYDNPDIYISTTDKEPWSGTSILGCSSLGEDICILSKETLQPNQTIYVGIGCGENMTTCSFNLIAELASELMLEDAKPI